MKKINRYRFAAMDIIVRAIIEQIEVQENAIASNAKYYADCDEMPEHAVKENERAQGIIDELNAFIERL